MKEYLEKVAKSNEGDWKHRLWRWGGALDICRRKELEIEKVLRLRDESIRIGDFYNQQEVMETIEKSCTEKIEHIRDIIVEVLKEKGEMDKLIVRLSPEEQRFLELRFEKGHQYNYISINMNLSRSSCFRMMDKIMEQLMEMED